MAQIDRVAAFLGNICKVIGHDADDTLKWTQRIEAGNDGAQRVIYSESAKPCNRCQLEYPERVIRILEHRPDGTTTVQNLL